MEDTKTTFHLMAVPKHFTSQVVEAGGRFLKMKNRPLSHKNLQMIYQEGMVNPLIHILDPEQHRTFEMLGEEYVEELSICKTVFEQNREGGYQIFQGDPQMVTCKECKKIFMNYSSNTNSIKKM